jgi:hypothetical protein
MSVLKPIGLWNFFFFNVHFASFVGNFRMKGFIFSASLLLRML